LTINFLRTRTATTTKNKHTFIAGFTHNFMPLKKWIMVSELFADVILPLPLANLFTYHIPSDMTHGLAPGMRVVVPFGKKKQYSGIIYSLHHNKPENYNTKPILSLLEHTPIVNAHQLNFWQWIAEYYQCTLGEVYKAALPSGLKLESESRIYYNRDFDQHHELSEKALSVIDLLAEKNVCTVNEINAHLQQKNSFNILQQLLDNDAIFVSEQLKESYKSKTENYLALGEEYRNETALHEVFDMLEKAPAQLNLLMTFLQKTGGMGETSLKKSIGKQE
jgi:primosomal protein N' (replication factor Y)